MARAAGGLPRDCRWTIRGLPEDYKGTAGVEGCVVANPSFLQISHPPKSQGPLTNSLSYRTSLSAKKYFLSMHLLEHSITTAGLVEWFEQGCR